jgi:hypothetical protein
MQTKITENPNIAIRIDFAKIITTFVGMRKEETM